MNPNNTSVAARVLGYAPAAYYLGLGQRTLRSLVELGKIPVVRISARRIGFLREDLDAYIAQQRS